MSNAFDYSTTPGCADTTSNVMANIAGAFTCYTAGGTADAQTVTMTPSLAAYSTAVRIAFKPIADNTGACTLNVNELGVKSIKLIDGSDPYAGALDASGVHIVQYDGTNFVLTNPSPATNSFTPILQGITSAGTGTYTAQVGRYTLYGKNCSIKIRLAWSAHTGTGNMRVTGLPFTSANTTFTPCAVYQSGLTVGAGKQFAAIIPPNTANIDLYANDVAGGSASLLAMDTAADILLATSYEVA